MRTPLPHHRRYGRTTIACCPRTTKGRWLLASTVMLIVGLGLLVRKQVGVDFDNRAADLVPPLPPPPPIIKPQTIDNKQHHDDEDFTEVSSRTTTYSPRTTTTTNTEPAYLPAIVIVTSTNGATTRSNERSRVLQSLCTGLNHDMMVAEAFSLYLSVDAVDSTHADTLKPEFQALCGGRSYTLSVDQAFWVHASDTTPGFPSSSTGRIAAHTGYALARAFDHFHHTHVLILEDDLEPAWDFIALFSSKHSPAIAALNHDPKVWCVSAWNDMGVKTHARNTKRLFRTDFFPGLGWMTTKRIWQEFLRPIWPARASTGWDNWMRSNNIYESECVVPEVNRVRHISTSGTNVNDPGLAVYGMYSFSGLNGGSMPPVWDLPGGKDGKAYDEYMLNLVQRASPRVDFATMMASGSSIPSEGVVTYAGRDIARVLDRFSVRVAMKDEARAGRKGVITLRAPEPNDEAFLFLVNEYRSDANKLKTYDELESGKLKLIPAKPGMNCDVTCQGFGMTCSISHLERISYPPGRGCAAMRRVFPCQGGCGHQMGLELPAYVSERGGETEGQCLSGESSYPTCGASHRVTSRLCACVNGG